MYKSISFGPQTSTSVHAPYGCYTVGDDTNSMYFNPG